VGGIRDYVVPERGLYVAQYNGWYHSDTLKDARGGTLDRLVLVEQITRGDRSVGPITLDLDVELNVFFVAPTFTFVPFEAESLGLRYGLFVQPTFSTTNVAASVSALGFERNVEEGGWDVGDMLIQPFWLGWGSERVDLSVSYGFYAPIGKYRPESTDNVGLGFSTHQFQAALGLYYMEEKAGGVFFTTTYELHSEKEGVDITPGSHVTFEYGISQFVLEHEGLLLEVGVSGYSQLQVTNDQGGDVPRQFRHVRDEVHAIGGQLGVYYVPWGLALNVRSLREYEAEDRFEGYMTTLTVAIQLPLNLGADEPADESE
jgi:hypothetical protein